MSLTLISYLSVQYREALEDILFFNSRQHMARMGIEKSVEKYGHPRIYEDAGRLGIRTDKFSEFQYLYAMDNTTVPAVLAGVLIFVRDPIDTLEALHIAAAEPYMVPGRNLESSAAYQLISALLRIGEKLRNIEKIGISCYRSKRIYFSVQRAGLEANGSAI